MSNPDVLVAMNLPSLDRFESAVLPGGIIFADSTLIARDIERTDVKLVKIPATQMASDNGTPTLANMILLGKILKELGQFDVEKVEAALKKVISAKRADMLEVNLKAMQLGADYEA
ncbi:MAG: 2-oxoacid:acceptor oxidoreductase family protein [Clostridia bacterium]|nr:2-oxoacid:acceptor oxidoreductase family protein [Clostridia bacterium]